MSQPFSVPIGCRSLEITCLLHFFQVALIGEEHLTLSHSSICRSRISFTCKDMYSMIFRWACGVQGHRTFVCMMKYLRWNEIFHDLLAIKIVEAPFTCLYESTTTPEAAVSRKSTDRSIISELIMKAITHTTYKYPLHTKLHKARRTFQSNEKEATPSHTTTTLEREKKLHKVTRGLQSHKKGARLAEHYSRTRKSCTWSQEHYNSARKELHEARTSSQLHKKEVKEGSASTFTEARMYCCADKNQDLAESTELTCMNGCTIN